MLTPSSPPPDIYRDVGDFLEKFGQAYDGPPRMLPPDLLAFRIGHMAEELDEYTAWAMHPGIPATPAAMKKAQAKLQEAENGAHMMLEEQFDALLDLVYVTLQTAHKQGFDFYAGWRRVHAANMAKEAHPDGKGGIRKPPGWVAPDLSDLV